MAERDSIPPLRELSGVRLEARKDHLLSEVVHESTPSPKPRGGRRRVLVLGACAMAAVAIASTLALSLGGSGNPGASGRGSLFRGEPFPYRVRIRYLRKGSVLVGIPIKAMAPYTNASVRVTVLRGRGVRPLEIVFQHSARMHDIINPSRLGMRSTWSSVLRPVRWRGGCQRAGYKVKISFRRGPPRGPFAASIENSSFFRCR